MKFYDRKEEISILQNNEQQASENAAFMVLMGRRRVGKTSLITKALEGRDYAYLFVSKDSETILCQKFQQALEEQLGIHIYGVLTHFRELFEVIMRESLQRHFTIVFDEFQMLRFFLDKNDLTPEQKYAIARGNAEKLYKLK